MSGIVEHKYDPRRGAYPNLNRYRAVCDACDWTGPWHNFKAHAESDLRLHKCRSRVLPNGCDRQRAEAVLALYDARRRGGYANQVIAERANVKRVTGMGVRELRRWLADN